MILICIRQSEDPGYYTRPTIFSLQTSEMGLNFIHTYRCGAEFCHKQLLKHKSIKDCI